MKPQKKISGNPRTEILATLNAIWKGYRRQLARCQRRLTEDALHDLRVQTRRLLACLEVLSPIAGGLTESARARKTLRKRLTALGPLRDAQVHLRDFDGVREAKPEISPLHHDLSRRARRLGRDAETKLERTGTRKLGRRIARFSRRLTSGLAEASSLKVLRVAFLATTEKALEELSRVGRANFRNHRAVHAVRVSLKQVRYGGECLPAAMRSITPAELKRVRKCVAWMGRIHDLDVQLARLKKLAPKNRLPASAAKSYRTDLTCRRAALTRQCLAFLRRRPVKINSLARVSSLPG